MFPFLAYRAVKMIDSMAENYKVRFNYFLSHATNTGLRTAEILSPLKLVMLYKNCNLNWLSSNVTQFCVVVSTRKL
jgi:hypothetical protein